jgi:hypothetical protein
VCRGERMCSLDAVKPLELELRGRARASMCARPNRVKRQEDKHTRMNDGNTFRERFSFSFKWRWSSGVSYNLQG